MLGKLPNTEGKVNISPCSDIARGQRGVRGLQRCITSGFRLRVDAT